ncbi:MAG: hypothetical protein KDK05_28330, partial [Candidatus Competibacteraceae bacterium]|nr:hypothetical protein [Candidatus Competibacteraceae bacterium]
PINSKLANAFVKEHHYSGKVVNNSQLHIGVYLHGILGGVMQFGPSLDKRKIQGLVEGTKWHEFLELNRMAFSDTLPRNSESRAIAIAMKLLKKHAPQVKWVISFADATQCGDGTIYRASGFVLTGIKKNDQIWKAPTGARESRTSLTDNRSKNEQRRAAVISRTTVTKSKHIIHSASLRPGIGAIGTAARTSGGSSMKAYIDAGFEPLDGYQLRYIYFIDPTYRDRLTVPELPFSAIDDMGARMYKGEKLDAPPVNGDNVATSHAGRFDPDPEA